MCRWSSWTGEQYPNTTSPNNSVNVNMACGATGCLFDVVADPTEHTNIASQHPAITAAMVTRLNELKKGFFSNNDTGVNVPECPKNGQMPCACYEAIHHWGGFFGPYQV